MEELQRASHGDNLGGRELGNAQGEIIDKVLPCTFGAYSCAASGKSANACCLRSVMALKSWAVFGKSEIGWPTVIVKAQVAVYSSSKDMKVGRCCALNSCRP
jgi:hypothetical protein